MDETSFGRPTVAALACFDDVYSVFYSFYYLLATFCVGSLLIVL
jgi:hypothetical protein